MASVHNSLLDKGQLDMIVRRRDLRPTLARLIDYSKGPKVESGAAAPE